MLAKNTQDRQEINCEKISIISKLSSGKPLTNKEVEFTLRNIRDPRIQQLAMFRRNRNGITPI